MTEQPTQPQQLPSKSAAAMARSRKRGQKKARAGHRPLRVAPEVEQPKRGLQPLDPLEAAQEAQRHAQEGNLKLSQAVEILRAGLEVIVFAEEDRTTGMPVSAKTLRQLAVGTLDTYGAHVGQNWRKAKLTGATRAGDKSIDEQAVLDGLREV